MVTVTIPKRGYEKLLDAQLRYQRLREVLEDDLFSPPPTRKRKDILYAFETSGKYSQAFLKSLSRGLARSSYFKE